MANEVPETFNPRPYPVAYYVRLYLSGYPQGYAFTTSSLQSILHELHPQARPFSNGAVSGAIAGLQRLGMVESAGRSSWLVIEPVPQPPIPRKSRPVFKEQKIRRTNEQLAQAQKPLSVQLMDLAVRAELLEKTSIETATEEQLLDALMFKRAGRAVR